MSEFSHVLVICPEHGACNHRLVILCVHRHKMCVFVTRFVLWQAGQESRLPTWNVKAACGVITATVSVISCCGWICNLGWITNCQLSFSHACMEELH